MACGKEIVAHDLVHPRLDRLQALLPDMLEIGLLVDRVMAHFGPGMVEQGLHLNFGPQPLKGLIFGKREPLGF